jgi:LysM repeat protein
MIRMKHLSWCLALILLTGLLRLPQTGRAASPPAAPAQASGVTAFDLILAMNTLRVSYGLPALIEDPIVNAVAQNTAQIMAANQMSWHIGDVRGRLAAAGYGGGATVWATENFAVGMSMGIDQIMLAWSDADHMRPATTAAYCHVGAGVAQAANGRTYYVLQAAYTSTTSCGPYSAPGDGTPDGTGSLGGRPVPGIIVPVKIATPDADGKIIHVVEAGQSFWAIAVAYKITIADIEFWNNLSRDRRLQIGQRLLIPGPGTEGYATPTPVGMVVPSPPDTDGRIVHVVQPYHTLITISQAYQVPLERILALNGIQADWPLQIDQKLLIYPGNVTPSPTPRPLTAIERLTPESDGRYYHTVRSGETLSWIASLYDIQIADLMAWNGIGSSAIIRPDQKLILLVTPPPTATHTPGPPSATPEPTHTHPPPTATQTPDPTGSNRGESTPVATSLEPEVEGWLAGALVAAGVLLLVGVLVRRRG